MFAWIAAVSVPIWLWIVLSASTLAACTSAIGYCCSKQVPFRIYAVPVGTLLAGIACIATFLFVRADIQLLELSLLLMAGTFATIGAVVRYRWEHGGKERYERATSELMEKRRLRIEARNRESRS